MLTKAKLIDHGLGFVGAVFGAVAGYFLFFWIIDQGFYAMMIPGAFVGMGAGLLAQHPSRNRGAVCAVGGLILGCYTEWSYAPFNADKSLGYFVAHLHHLRPITLLMIAAGAIIAYMLGKDAGFISTPFSRNR